MLLALFGAAMGQGVVWYTGQFYSMSFMKTVMHLHTDQADMILGIALLCGTPFFIVFGWLSDKIGRKWIMLTGMALALFTYRPIYEQMYQLTNIDNKIELVDKKEVKEEMIEKGDKMVSQIITKRVYNDGTITKEIITNQPESEIKKDLHGHPIIQQKTSIHLSGINYVFLIALIFIQIIYITLVYGPIAAFLVEIFPVKIRYTSMSLPYHIGNGVFGGLLPAVSTYLATNAQTMQDPEYYLAGLWYPIIISAVCFIIGALYINKNIYAKN